MVAKISISLGEDDVAYLDAQTLAGSFASRSAAVHQAIRLLRESELADAYAEAFGDWAGDVAADWDETSGDGVSIA